MQSVDGTDGDKLHNKHGTIFSELVSKIPQLINSWEIEP